MKKINKFIKTRWVRLGILSIFLLLLWALLTSYTIVKLDSSLSVLSYPHFKNSFTPWTGDKIIKGHKVTGEFRAIENNLGIVSIRFKTFQRVAYEDEGVLIFRLKEKGQKKWYYFHTYKSGLFFNVPFYTFGFPLIKNSQNKIYVFELESTRGNNYNAVSISDREPVLATKYQENKFSLFSNKKLLLAFFAKKFINSFQFIDIDFFSFIYLLPFIFFVLLPNRIQRSLMSHIISDNAFKSFIEKASKYFDLFLIQLNTHFDLFLIFLIVIQIFYIRMENDLIYLVIIVLYIITMKRNKLRNGISLTVGFFFIILSALTYYLKSDDMAEQAGTWAYLFFLVCFVQSFIQLRSKKNPNHSTRIRGK